MLEETQPYPEGQDDYASTAPRLPYIHIPSPQPEQPPPPPVQQSSTSPSDMDQLLATHRLGRIQQEYKSEVTKFLVIGASYFLSGILFLLPQVVC